MFACLYWRSASGSKSRIKTIVSYSRRRSNRSADVAERVMRLGPGQAGRLRMLVRNGGEPVMLPYASSVTRVEPLTVSRRRDGQWFRCLPHPIDASAIPDELCQHDRVVVLGVAGGVDDGDRPLLRAAAQVLDVLTACRELVAVARAELREALGNMVEPFAQLVAGRQLARPLVQVCALARDATRPDVVDQHPVAVAGVRVVVGALGAHVDGHRYCPG